MKTLPVFHLAVPSKRLKTLSGNIRGIQMHSKKFHLTVAAAIAASIIGCAPAPTPTTAPDTESTQEATAESAASATPTAEAQPAVDLADGALAPKGVPRETFYAP